MCLICPTFPAHQNWVSISVHKRLSHFSIPLDGVPAELWASVAWRLANSLDVWCALRCSFEVWVSEYSSIRVSPYCSRQVRPAPSFVWFCVICEWFAACFVFYLPLSFGFWFAEFAERSPQATLLDGHSLLALFHNNSLCVFAVYTPCINCVCENDPKAKPRIQITNKMLVRLWSMCRSVQFGRNAYNNMPFVFPFFPPTN